MLPCADISKVQDDEVGDGTTSVVVFACELLKVKPNTFYAGFGRDGLNADCKIFSYCNIEEYAECILCMFKTCTISTVLGL